MDTNKQWPGKNPRLSNSVPMLPSLFASALAATYLQETYWSTRL